MTDKFNSRQFKQYRRAELFGEQNGLCFWCEEPMQLLSPYPTGGSLPARACTIDHLRDRDNPRRTEQGATRAEPRWVAACFECNQVRDGSRMRTDAALQRMSA